MPEQTDAPQRRVPYAALGAIVAAFEDNDDESTWYLNLATGAVSPISDDARRDLEAVCELLPEEFAAGTLDDQRSMLANAIENANHLASIPEVIEEAFLVEKGRGVIFIEVPRLDSRDGHRIMAAFVEALPPGRLRYRLDEAVHARGAARRFADIVRGEPDELERWYAFRRASLEERARAWLRGEGVQIVDR